MFLLQLASTMREWDIPYEDLAIGDPIGKGRFGTVHKFVFGFIFCFFRNNNSTIFKCVRYTVSSFYRGC